MGKQSSLCGGASLSISAAIGKHYARGCNPENLEEVHANYALFQYTMKYRKYDEACLQYTVTKRIFRKLKRKLSQEERKSEQVQQAAACVAKAKDELSRAGGFTLRNQLETALCVLNPKWFFAYKYGA